MAASYQPNLAFDTLGFAQALIAKGYEREDAEALSVVIRDHVVNGLATNDFVDRSVQDAKVELKNEIDKVRNEIDKAKVELKNEIIMAENRTLQTTGKMLAFAVGVMLAGIPIIQALLARLG